MVQTGAGPEPDQFDLMRDADWRLHVSPAGRWTTPLDIPLDADWHPAVVPGTVAAALEKAGLFDRANPAPLHTSDVWYEALIQGQGRYCLSLEGLATIAEIWLDGDKIGVSTSMFVPLEIEVTLKGSAHLRIVFRALAGGNLPVAKRRQRWRPHLIKDGYMRSVRSTLLGHMPGWCPSVDVVGPFRPIRFRKIDAPGPREVRIRAGLEGRTGILDVSCVLDEPEGIPELECGGVSTPMQRDGVGRYFARLCIDHVPLWWPHTHGTPVLHPVEVRCGNSCFSLGKAGFRSVALDRGADGQGVQLIINDVPVFCRGASWTNADLITLPGERDQYLPLLVRARDAGMNMLRVSGIMTYETKAFHDLLDELGILCWQDLMLANFDYDFDDTAFAGQIDAEIAALFDRAGASPSLVVVCGGSEVAQQAAMLSLPEMLWSIPFFVRDLEPKVAGYRPDMIVVPNSPWGGDLPFSSHAGVSHYYGVGAYQQPLSDARRANVRFASECLAFAQLPQPEAMPTDLLPDSQAWKAAVVRDLGASWDFEDTRDFYLASLYGVDPERLRVEAPARYIALSQAVCGEVMEATFAEWRRKECTTAGGLVWHLKDLGPGFGWGVIDHQWRPKPAYYALKRAFRPLQVVFTDEGVNGLYVHAINDTAAPRHVTLCLSALASDGSVVIDGKRDLLLAPHSVMRLTSAELFGVFFDVTHVYRFGALGHEAAVVQMLDSDTGEWLADQVYFVAGRRAEQRDCGVKARVERSGETWFLLLEARCLAQSVHIACPGFEPGDDWFHLVPGQLRRIALVPDGSAGSPVPTGHVQALNDAVLTTF